MTSGDLRNGLQLDDDSVLYEDICRKLADHFIAVFDDNLFF